MQTVARECGGGGGDALRTPQSPQSVPTAHIGKLEPGPSSSQSSQLLSEENTLVSKQKRDGGGGEVAPRTGCRLPRRDTLSPSKDVEVAPNSSMPDLSSALSSRTASSNSFSAFIRPNMAAVRATSLQAGPGICESVTTTLSAGGREGSGSTPKRSGKPESWRSIEITRRLRPLSCSCAKAIAYTFWRSLGYALTSAPTALSVDMLTNELSTLMWGERRAHVTTMAFSRRPLAYLSICAVTGAMVMRTSACFDSKSDLTYSSTTARSLVTRVAVSVESMPFTCSASVVAYTFCIIVSSSIGIFWPRADAASLISSMGKLTDASAESMACTAGSASST